jgi:hypothetical protein
MLFLLIWGAQAFVLGNKTNRLDIPTEDDTQPCGNSSTADSCGNHTRPLHEDIETEELVVTDRAPKWRRVRRWRFFRGFPAKTTKHLRAGTTVKEVKKTRTRIKFTAEDGTVSYSDWVTSGPTTETRTEK